MLRILIENDIHNLKIFIFSQKLKIIRLLCEGVNCDDVQEQGFHEPLMMSRHVRRTTSLLTAQ